MANECTLVYETELPIPFKCSNSTGISKGSILALSDPMTVSLASGTNAVIAGIAAEEKIANDGKTSIAVYRHGIFKGVSAGNITAGDALNINTGGGSNLLVAAGAGAENILGRSLETAVATDTFLFELNPFTVNLS